MEDEERLRSVLLGLRNEFYETSEITRGMGNSLLQGVALLINKGGTLNINEKRGAGKPVALDTVDDKHQRIKCHYCKKFVHMKPFSRTIPEAQILFPGKTKCKMNQAMVNHRKKTELKN